MNKLAVVVLFCLALLVLPLSAQETGPAGPAAADEAEAVLETPAREAAAETLAEETATAPEETAPTAPAAAPPENEAAEAPGEGNVSLDLKDADIQNVLRILAYKSGVNIVAGPEVTGLVTIKIQDVPWQRALQVILQTYGYAYAQQDNIITVTTVENLKKRREDAKLLSEQEPLVTQTFTLNYAKAADIIASIEKMKTERGSINYDERTNALIVRDIPGNVELIGDVIHRLDATTPQVMIEAKIVETTLNDAENMGIDWTAKVTISGGKRPYIDPLTKSPASSKYFPGNFPNPADSLFTYGTLDVSQVQAVFELLNSRTDTNVLSNPRIVTLDNQTAKIIVGSQYPIPEYTYNEEQARLQVSGWEYKDIGIIFEVTPHVNNAGYVTVDLEPKITAILDFVTVENTSLPRLSTEEAKTRVMIKDGETLVIGGLIKDQVTDIKKKIPFVGDIPLLGLMFRKTEKTVVKTDLLIFLTPHIIYQDIPAGEK